MENNRWQPLGEAAQADSEGTRASLTYWQDVWHRFVSNKLALVGLVLITIITLFSIFGPMFTSVSYSDQNLELGNIPPIVKATKLSEDQYVFVQEGLYSLVSMSEDGHIIGLLKPVKNDTVNRQKIYDVEGMEVLLDYSKAKKGTAQTEDGKKYELVVDGQKIDLTQGKSMWNKTYPFGTDKLGRDVFVRTMHGGRISLLVGIVSAIITMIVGVAYGGISGYEGGGVDNVMMRIVDLINSIPLMLIVILLMVVTGKNNVGIVITTIGLVYWLPMARQVRGQVMSLKTQEFVLAARALGASKSRIIFRHLIPNAMGPIVISMMMSIPQAIFTESFLSFVGLGVAAPNASWGTLANDALGGIRSYPYLLIIPSIAIALTMFAFNFVGDGLRDALDPKQRQ